MFKKILFTLLVALINKLSTPSGTKYVLEWKTEKGVKNVRYLYVRPVSIPSDVESEKSSASNQVSSGERE